MKARITSVLILATALGATVLSAAPKNDLPVAFSTTTITVQTYRGDDQIARGDSRAKVRSLLDCPSQELSRDVWLYHGFFADLKQANEQGCRTMIVRFAGDKVVDLQFVNRRAATIIAANPDRNLPSTYIARQ